MVITTSSRRHKVFNSQRLREVGGGASSILHSFCPRSRVLAAPRFGFLSTIGVSMNVAR